MSLHAEAVATLASTTSAKHQRKDHQGTEEDHHPQGAKHHGAEATFGDTRSIGFSERNDGGIRVQLPVDVKRPQRDLMGAKRCSTRTDRRTLYVPSPATSSPPFTPSSCIMAHSPPPMGAKTPSRI